MLQKALPRVGRAAIMASTAMPLVPALAFLVALTPYASGEEESDEAPQDSEISTEDDPLGGVREGEPWWQTGAIVLVFVILSLVIVGFILALSRSDRLWR